MENTHCIHHSDVSGEIQGCAHTFCNEKVRQNYFRIPVIAHNLFQFDFFFLLKGLRAGVWKTRDIGGKNPTDVNFASIGNQVRFLDAVKYYQQSLTAFASSLTDDERAAIYSEREKYLLSDSVLSKRFLYCTKEEKKWVLDYLSSGKGIIPYKLVCDFDSLSIAPEDGNFFKLHKFYLSMKDSVLSEEEYENLKKFYKTLKLNNLGELNQICNFQDTIILCEIFERRSTKFQEMFKFNPKNAIVLVALAAVLIGTKVSVVLFFLQMLNMSQYLKKQLEDLVASTQGLLLTLRYYT